MATISLNPTFSHCAARMRPQRSRFAHVAGLWRETLDTLRGMLVLLSAPGQELGAHISRDLGLD